MSPCGHHSSRKFTSNRIHPAVVEDDGKTFPECSSSCSWDRWHLLWLLIYRESRPFLPKSGQRIVRGGVVCWVWAVLSLPHPEVLSSVWLLWIFPQEQLCHFYHPCAPVNVAEVCRALSCFSLAIKLKEGLGSPCAAAGDAVPVCLTHPGELALCLCSGSCDSCAASPWVLLLVNWAEGECRWGWGGGTPHSSGGMCSRDVQSCSWAGHVHQWSSGNSSRAGDQN